MSGRTVAAIVSPSITFSLFWRSLCRALDDVLGEGDRVWLTINGGDAYAKTFIEQEIAKWQRKVSYPIEVTWSWSVLHGPEVSKILRIAPGKVLLLLEDDCFMGDRPDISGCFQAVERGHVQVVTSQHGVPEPDLIEAEAKRWPETADDGCLDCWGAGIWPNMTFVDLERVRKLTDCDFAGHVYPAGEEIPGLGWTPPRAIGSDPGHWLGIQMHAAGMRFDYVPQCRATSYPCCRTVDPTLPWDDSEFPPWVHVGQGSYLRGVKSVEEVSAGVEPIGGCTSAALGWLTTRDAIEAKMYDRAKQLVGWIKASSKIDLEKFWRWESYFTRMFNKLGR